MDTVQLFFRTRNAKDNEELLDKVQSYLAALLHNGQIVGDHTPMARVSGGYLVIASLPETDALATVSQTSGSVSVFENRRLSESPGRR